MIKTSVAAEIQFALSEFADLHCESDANLVRWSPCEFHTAHYWLP